MLMTQMLLPSRQIVRNRSQVPAKDRPDNFRQVALPHIDAILRTATALCGRADQAQDLAQATFLKAIENWRLFRPGTNCKAWLLQILRNTWIDTLRKDRRTESAMPVEEMDVPAPVDSCDDAPVPADVLEEFSDKEVIAALASLPEPQRLALYLVDVERMTLGEIGEILGVPVGTVKSRAGRARLALREKLRAHALDLGFGSRRA